MNELRLLPGPRLLWQAYPMPEVAVVTDHAHEFLFEIVELDPAVTLGDVLELLIRNDTLRAVFRRNFADEICEEAAKEALPDESAEKDPTERIEFLELYSQWHLNTHTQQHDAHSGLQLHGVGPVLTADAPDYGRKQGERIQWGVSCAALRELLTLPVRVTTEVSVREADIDAQAYLSEIHKVLLNGVTLGQVIDGLLGELTFHGGPQQAAELNESLRQQVADIEAGTVVTTSSDDLFDDMYRAGCACLFDTIGNQTPAGIDRAVREIPDAALAVQVLHDKFGAEVLVKEEFKLLGGRDFRVAFRKARRGDTTWLDQLRERVKSRQETGG